MCVCVCVCENWSCRYVEFTRLVFFLIQRNNLLTGKIYQENVIYIYKFLPYLFPSAKEQLNLILHMEVKSRC